MLGRAGRMSAATPSSVRGNVIKGYWTLPFKVVHPWRCLRAPDVVEVDARVLRCRGLGCRGLGCRLLCCRYRFSRGAAQLFSTPAVPFVHIGVASSRKGLLGKVGRERLARVWMPEAPVAHRKLHIGDVLFGSQQDLETLPAHEALQRQGRNAGLFENVLSGQQRVLNAQGRPDVRDGLVWCVDEERVIVTTHCFVEGGKFRPI